MQTKTDAELLSEYARNKSEAAFSEIVRRYADAVYSSALRQVGNDAQARDVAQTVFVDLAHKAASLGTHTLLIGWLHRGARLAALELIRKEQRRQIRERLAMEFQDQAPEPNDWNTVRPVLDEAIANLGEEDRNALLLRFFRNESLASVGTTLGVSEDAAQKRVSRALGKLRDILEQRGIKTTGAALAAALAANAVQSAPANFAASMTASVLAKAALTGGTAAPLLNLFTTTNMKTALLILSLAGGIAGITLVRVQSQHRLIEAQAIVQQQAQEIESLRAANEDLANQTNQMGRLREEARDVLRLRGEVARMRREQAAQKAAISAQAALSAANDSTNATVPQINIRVKFISGSLNGSALAGNLTGILTDQQTSLILQSLEKLDGADLLGQCQMVTLSGREGTMQISPDSLHTNDPTFTVDVLPEYGTNSRIINLKFTIGSEITVDLPPEDSPPNAQAPVREVRTLQITNSLSVGDGQTVVLGRQLSSNGLRLKDRAINSTAPQYVTILITPTLVDSAGNRLFEDSVPLPQAESSGGVFPGVLPKTESP